MTEGEHDHQPEAEAETLIGRIIDREATPGDCETFERLASVDPILWRSLALRHLDMAMLSDRVGAHTEAAERVELHARGRPWHLLVTLSGWAAVLVVGLWWAVAGMARGPVDAAPGSVQAVAEPSATAAPLTPAEHYEKYLQASFVLGELDPILLETRALPDGRYELRFIRRIEEHLVIDAPASAILDESGNLTVDPDELRRGAGIPEAPPGG